MFSFCCIPEERSPSKMSVARTAGFALGGLGVLLFTHDAIRSGEQQRNTASITDLGDWFNTSTRPTSQVLENRLMLVDFWGTYCPPCIAQIDHLNSLQAKYGERGLVVLGLSAEPSEQVATMAGKMEYFVAANAEGPMKRFSVSAVPTVVLMTANGEIKAQFTAPSNETLRMAIEENLVSIESRPREPLQFEKGAGSSPALRDLFEVQSTKVSRVETRIAEVRLLEQRATRVGEPESASALQALLSRLKTEDSSDERGRLVATFNRIAHSYASQPQLSALSLQLRSGLEEHYQIESDLSLRVSVRMIIDHIDRKLPWLTPDEELNGIHSLMSISRTIPAEALDQEADRLLNEQNAGAAGHAAMIKLFEFGLQENILSDELSARRKALQCRDRMLRILSQLEPEQTPQESREFVQEKLATLAVGEARFDKLYQYLVFSQLIRFGTETLTTDLRSELWRKAYNLEYDRDLAFNARMLRARIQEEGNEMDLILPKDQQ